MGDEDLEFKGEFYMVAVFLGIEITARVIL